MSNQGKGNKDEKPKLQIRAPEVPCDDCINTKGKILEDELVFVYCSHNFAGAVYSIDLKTWQVFHPVNVADFTLIVNGSISRARLLKALGEQHQAKNDLPKNPRTFN